MTAIALRRPAAIVQKPVEVVVRSAPVLVPDFGDGDGDEGGAFSHPLGAGPDWVIGAYCEAEDAQYYYLARPVKKGWKVVEVWPTPQGAEVGTFATIDEAVEDILDALEEP